MVAAALATSSCQDGFIFEGEGDCGTYYRIRFRYDYNIKFADAFAAEVNSIALYVFDENDVLSRKSPPQTRRPSHQVISRFRSSFSLENIRLWRGEVL